MKKIFFASLLYVLVFPLNAQQLKLRVDDVFPRMGDSIQYTCELHNEGLLAQFEELKSKTFPFENCKAPNSVLMTKTFELKAEDIIGDNVKLGPDTIEFNGDLFYSDSLILPIQPALPEVPSGFWVNYFKFQGEPYIIIEQRIKKRVPPKGKDKNFVAMNEKVFNSEHMAVIQFVFRSEVRPLGNETSTTKNWCSSSKKIYKLWLSDDFPDDFQLTTAYFTNYSDSLGYDPITLKK